jgi:hypothetical protein
MFSIAPLTSLTSTNIPWKWGEEQSKAFQEAKKFLSKKVLLAFPIFDKTFTIHTDASHRQLGAVIHKMAIPSLFTVKNLMTHKHVTPLQNENSYPL